MLISLKSVCPFCLREFDHPEDRTAHLIFERCEPQPAPLWDQQQAQKQQPAADPIFVTIGHSR